MALYTKYFNFGTLFGTTQYEFQNVEIGDTVRCYFQLAAGDYYPWNLLNQNNCSSTPTSGLNNTYADVTFTTVGSYDITWRSVVFDFDGNPANYTYGYANLSGTVSTSTPIDNVPDAPELGVTIEGQPINTWIVNPNTLTISGMDSGISFSATTDQQGQLSTGPNFDNWATSQTVTLNSTLKVRVLSSSNYIAYTHTTLRYVAPGGTVSDTWSVRTMYQPPDTDVTPSSSTIGPYATSASTTITNVTSNEWYAVRLNNGTTNITEGFSSSSTISLSFSTNLPTLGNTITYEIFVMRPLGSGGDGIYYPTDDTFTVTRANYSVPDQDVSPSSSNIAPTATSASVLVGGVVSGEEYAVRIDNGTTNLVSGTATSTSISLTFSTSLPVAEGATVTYEIFSRKPVSQNGDGVTWYPTNDTFTVTRLIAPDTSVSPSSSTISSTATSATTVVSGVTSGEVYAVRLNNGTTDLVTGTATGTSITLTFTSNLPAVGNTTTYEIFSLRVGGSNGESVFYPTDDTFTVTRSYTVPDTSVSPSSSTITSTATSASTTVTGVTSGEEYAVRLNNGSTNLATGTATSSVITLTFTSNLPTFGATTTYEIFSLSPTSLSGDGVTYYPTDDTFTVTRSYAVPDTSVSPSSSTITSTATSASTTVTGVTSGEEYVVRLNNGSTNLATGTATSTAITLTFTSNLPTFGATTTYEIFSLSPTSLGGDGVTYYPTDDTFTVTRSYILPDIDVTPSSNTISAFATSAFTYVTGVTSGEEYAVRLNNGSTNLATGTTTSTAITLTFTSNLPAPGATTTYEIFSLRPTSLGGDGVTWYPTDDTFNITRTAYDTTPNTPNIGPDLLSQELNTPLYSSIWTVTGMDPSPASTTASVTAGALSVNGGAYVTSATVFNGNTIQVRLTSANTYDTIVATTLSVGGVSDDWLITTKVDDTVPTPDPITPPPGSNYGLQVFSSSGAIRLDTTDRLARIYSTHTGTINSGTTVVINVPGYNPSDPTFGVDWYPMGSQYSISAITNQVSITRVADGGASSTYVLKIFRI